MDTGTDHRSQNTDQASQLVHIKKDICIHGSPCLGVMEHNHNLIPADLLSTIINCSKIVIRDTPGSYNNWIDFWEYRHSTDYCMWYVIGKPLISGLSLCTLLVLSVGILPVLQSVECRYSSGVELRQRLLMLICVLNLTDPRPLWREFLKPNRA